VGGEGKGTFRKFKDASLLLHTEEYCTVLPTELSIYWEVRARYKKGNLEMMKDRILKKFELQSGYRIP
jgi:hypothetical protein